MSNIALLVYDVTLTGGAERVAINLAGEFAKTDNVFLISVAMSEELPKDASERVTWLTLADKMGSITLNFPRYSWRLRKILKKHQIDILMSVTAGVVTLAVSAARGTEAKVIYCEHSSLENRTYGKKHIFRQHYGADHADAVVALTKRDRMNFSRMFKTPASKLYVIPNWYTPDGESQAYDSHVRRIMSVGRLERVKGYEYIVESAERILRDNPDWEWDIYGDGTLREEIESMIRERDIERLHLTGNATDIRKRYHGYAFLVMTSLYEGLSMAMLEAQTAGLPIVSFDCPSGPAEVIDDGVNGYLVPMFDMDSLVGSMQRLIDSEKLRADFSAHAGDGLYRYEKERVLRMWEKLFDKLLAQ